MLQNLIKSKIARKILTVFLTHPKEKFYLRQLERLVGASVSSIDRQLKSLESLGLLENWTEGRIKYFTVNDKHPIFPEIRNIILKTEALGDYLKDVIKDIPQIKIAFIYGSVARGDENAHSDIDLMIIGHTDGLKLHEQISKIEDKLNRPIHYNLIGEEDIKRKQTNFIQRVFSEKKIFLIGSADELQRLYSSRKN